MPLSDYHYRIGYIRLEPKTGAKISRKKAKFVRGPVCNCCSTNDANHRRWQKYPRKNSLRDHRR